jgi:hypothetical protein
VFNQPKVTIPDCDKCGAVERARWLSWGAASFNTIAKQHNRWMPVVYNWLWPRYHMKPVLGLSGLQIPELERNFPLGEHATDEARKANIMSSVTAWYAPARFQLNQDLAGNDGELFITFTTLISCSHRRMDTGGDYGVMVVEWIGHHYPNTLSRSLTLSLGTVSGGHLLCPPTQFRQLNEQVTDKQFAGKYIKAIEYLPDYAVQGQLGLAHYRNVDFAFKKG